MIRREWNGQGNRADVYNIAIIQEAAIEIRSPVPYYQPSRCRGVTGSARSA